MSKATSDVIMSIGFALIMFLCGYWAKEDHLQRIHNQAYYLPYPKVVSDSLDKNSVLGNEIDNCPRVNWGMSIPWEWIYRRM